MADWCTKATAPSNVVICSDAELRRMAVIRNKIFADARRIFSEDDMKELTAEQSQWVHEYTGACGASVNGLAVNLPVPQNVIDCFKKAGRDRIAELVRDLRDAVPGYQVPAFQVVSITPAPQLLPPVSFDRAQQEKAAQDERRKLQVQAAESKLSSKLKELGFQLLTPVDLNLDWKTFMASKAKVAVRGTYVEAHDVEMLSTPDNRDKPSIRLYTDDASRPARKAMLECRNSGFVFSSCQMVVGATVQNCIRNKGELNEKEEPCFKVQEAFVIP